MRDGFKGLQSQDARTPFDGVHHAEHSSQRLVGRQIFFESQDRLIHEVQILVTLDQKLACRFADDFGGDVPFRSQRRFNLGLLRRIGRLIRRHSFVCVGCGTRCRRFDGGSVDTLQQFEQRICRREHTRDDLSGWCQFATADAAQNFFDVQSRAFDLIQLQDARRSLNRMYRAERCVDLIEIRDVALPLDRSDLVRDVCQSRLRLGGE
ncbi:MAG: hypothetical protein FD138_4387, partial [Planctomycetota bacterium]